MNNIRYEIIDLSNTTFEDLVNRIKFDFMYNQNNTIFILNKGKYVKSINYEMFSTVYPNFTKEFFCQVVTKILNIKKDLLGKKNKHSYSKKVN